MRRRGFEMTAIALLAVLSVFGAACGGGGGGGGVAGGGPGGGGPLVATFTSANPTPGANSVSFGNGTISGDMVTFDVLVTDLNDVFGATFTLNFDSTLLTFMTVDTSNSFIDVGGVQTQIEAVPGAAGELFITATRFNGVSNYVGGIDATGSQELISLTFRVDAATAGTALTINGNDLFTCNDGSQTCASSALAINWSAATLGGA